MDTLFIVGREPEFSAAELEARAPEWGATVIDVTTHGVVLRHAQPLLEGVLAKLGGSIKQVEVLECLDPKTPLAELLTEHVTSDWVKKHFSEGRIEFGGSGYGLTGSERQVLQKHLLGVKKAIHAAGRPVRLVTSREPQLSAVTVQRNGLLKKGKEFIFFRTGESFVIGLTTAVQDYQAYGLRDYGRPAADAKSGMLPPKLAQMMLNFAQVIPDDVLLDPFCGSGTVLQEALLIGVQEVHGSDNDTGAIKASQENLRWLLKEFPSINADAEVTLRDAAETVDPPTVIVTEPYLGKPLRGHEPEHFLRRQADELTKLYRRVAEHWQAELKPGGRMVMIWPAFVFGEGVVAITLEKEFTDLGFVAQPLLSQPSADVLNQGDRFVLTYGRDDARVRRQVRSWKKV